MAEKLNKEAAKAKKRDGGGLLLVKSNGVKRWLFICRFNGNRNRLGFGVYPDATLEDARVQVANGINPGATSYQANTGTKGKASSSLG